LESLSEAGIHFILVGGLAAVLNGASIQTYDVDIVYSLDGKHRPPTSRIAIVRCSLPHAAEKRLRPTKGHLSGGSHLDLLTRYGPLDLLARIGQDLGFPELLRHSIEMSD